MNSKYKELKLKYDKYKWPIWFIAGILVVLVFLIPYYVLRENAFFMIHDELDDGIFKYMLYAKNFGNNGSFIPEFMGGQNRYTITISTFWGIFLYKTFAPYAAFAIMLTIVVFTGYTGVYLLGKEISDNAFASFAAACLFSYLPFKSMFGLNIVGFPLLIYLLIKLGKVHQEKYWLYFLILIYYAFGTTLAWAGFMSIGFLTLAIIGFSIFDKKHNVYIGNLVVADIILIAIQIFTSWDLIKSTVGPAKVVSHREELILNSYDNIWALFKEMMYIGGSHSECCSKVIALSAIVLLIGVPILVHFMAKAQIDNVLKINTKYKLLCIFYGANVLNALFTCFYCNAFIVGLRQNLGGIFKTFQANRIYWIMPACWMAVLILEIAILWDIAEVFIVEFIFKKMRFIALLPCVVIFTLVLIYARNVYLSSPFYHNIRLMFFPDTYHVESWRKYYAEDLYAEIDEAIGRDKSTYRVASIGVDPAVALFNGFYTVDGYSTDYPLEYKHRFREIIEKELDKNESNKGYFDNWGNRCFVYTADLGNRFDIYRGENTEINIDINTAKLKEMGGEYIFSAVKIANADSLGLTSISDTPFIKDADSYGIWVYEVK